MYKICKTVQSCERQKAFEQTLFQMMETQDFRDITVSALCRQMSAPRKAFYRYFDTMEDVLNAFLYEVLLGAYIYLEVRLELKKFFEYWKEQKHILDVLEKNGLSHRLMDSALGFVLSVENENDLSQKDMIHVGQSTALLTAVIMWHHNGMKHSIEEMETLVIQMFGLKKDKM